MAIIRQRENINLHCIEHISGVGNVQDEKVKKKKKKKKNFFSTLRKHRSLNTYLFLLCSV